MNKKILSLLVFVILAVVVVAPMVASAQAAESSLDKCTITKDISAGGIDCPTGDCVYAEDGNCGLCCLLNAVYTVTDWVFIFLMAISALMIIIGAVTYTTAGGETAKIEKGRNYIMYAAIGIAIALFSRAVPYLVKVMMGVQ